jgi:UDP-N-acetylmuramoyl-tripeptide--D-alanyl-D-alanine ligase
LANAWVFEKVQHQPSVKMGEGDALHGTGAMIRYTHDTRTLQPGDYYVAVRGERYDGHIFVSEAIRKGAAGIIVDRRAAVMRDIEIPPHVECIRVPDTVAYLAREANRRLMRLGCKVVAITGSVGKTTVKRAVVTVLREAFPVVTPQGNWNTLLGISLTILNELTHSAQVFVTEMGIYYRSDLLQMCSIIPPTVGLVTNVQAVHLDTLGTIENVALAKSELVESIGPDGIACLNIDDPRVRAMQSRCRGRVLFYGTQEGADIVPDRLRAEIPLLGSYRTQTALAALSVAECFTMPDEQIQAGLTKLKSEKGRLVKLAGRNGAILIDDTYNASLLSSMAALDTLLEQPATRRVAFLGDMLELGSEEDSAHRAVLARVLEFADQVVLVGPRFSRAARHFIPQQVATFTDSLTTLAALKSGALYVPAAGDVVLIKGSAGIRMERLTASLLSPELDPRAVLVRQESSWQP